MGEVGLGGEVRRVPGIERRLTEAARLGFERAIVPNGLARAPKGITCIAVSDVLEATRELGATLQVVGAG
jgi:DNA repair protein RadA/Sms